jgi:hypothetical protein
MLPRERGPRSASGNLDPCWLTRHCVFWSGCRKQAAFFVPPLSTDMATQPKMVHFTPFLSEICPAILGLKSAISCAMTARHGQRIVALREALLLLNTLTT